MFKVKKLRYSIVAKCLAWLLCIVSAVGTGVLGLCLACGVYGGMWERRYPYYRIQVKNYTIFYVVIGNTMEVRRIIYSRRNLQNLI